MTTKLEFLKQIPIFDGLYEDELRALAQICDEYEFEKGSVVAYQRDVANSLYMVRKGRLFARGVDERGIVRDEPTRPYFAGDTFGQKWLFAAEAHPATVRGAENGRLLILEGPRFLQFLEKHPGVLERLEPELGEDGDVLTGLSEEAWVEAQKSRIKADKRSTAVSLLHDELVEFYTRRSRYYLLLRLLFPAFGLLILPLLSFIVIRGDPGTVQSAARFIVPVLLLLLFTVWLIFQFLDWSNDYFVITNKHLVHREFELRRFRTNVNKIPIDQIQSVEVIRPSFLSNLFNYGTARITTAAQTRALYFDNIDNPRRVEEALDDLRQRVQALDAGRAQATMRRSIEGHFQARPPILKIADEKEEDELEPVQTGGFRAVYQAFKKRYQSRVVEDGVITYRKHFFVLAKEISWPVGILAALFLISLILVRVLEFTVLQIVFPMTALGLIGLGFLVWQIEDWRNDTFQLTDRYVFDIDRRPFGFGESRKQAELSNVQNINSDRPSFLATIFNYGNVVIETAGATADITFENVSNPNRIQSDIFKRRDQFRQAQRVLEGERRRKEYAVLLDVYQQAQEQSRIPRRTPPPEEAFEGYLAHEEDDH